jgi:hypothetical protein
MINIRILGTQVKTKDLPKMLMFYDWLSETKIIIVRDSFFRKTISIVLLSFIVIINQPRGWIV